MKRVAEGIYEYRTTVTGTDMNLSLYLIRGAEWLVTDAGCRGQIAAEVRPELEGLERGAVIGRAVVCHAHADHFGGCRELKDLYPDCRILVHSRDAAWVRDPARHLREGYDWIAPDYVLPTESREWVASLLGSGVEVDRLEAGDTLPLDDGTAFTVIQTGGHSPGHIALWEPERRLMIASDAILGSGQIIGGKVVAIPAYLDVDQYLGSVRAIQWLLPQKLCTAHYGLLVDEEVGQFCAISTAFVFKMDEAVRAALEVGPASLQTLTARVMPLVAEGVAPSAVGGFTVQAHLDWLARRGLATFRVEGMIRVWRRT